MLEEKLLNDFTFPEVSKTRTVSFVGPAFAAWGETLGGRDEEA